ncbi:YfiT family bacillithiol transferase [Bacillus alkalicellulosilyticus]|uniref:YfiT family bacillithiol transferase n=1 Tax=Alkalihalobacterium alkalicellulosilyticum TaxID=1912214 RepID=UPI0009968527|nr:putative metal-dependent hydrolase [Bacillus alkalicellulosilyticus]
MDVRYPIGKFQVDGTITEQQIAEWIQDISELPQKMSKLISELSEDQLNSSYRDGGWTVKQVVHHVADSHMNAFIRFKLALTEDNPTIKPYFEERWATLSDTTEAPVALSLSIIEGLHQRWVMLLNSKPDLTKTFYHPELDRSIRLDENVGMYAWHGNHHLAHIKLVQQ